MSKLPPGVWDAIKAAEQVRKAMAQHDLSPAIESASRMAREYKSFGTIAAEQMAAKEQALAEWSGQAARLAASVVGPRASVAEYIAQVNRQLGAANMSGVDLGRGPISRGIGQQLADVSAFYREFFASRKDITASIRSALASADILTDDIRADLSRNLPDVPASGSEETTRRWNREILQWCADALKAIRRVAGAEGSVGSDVLIGLVIGLIFHVLAEGSSGRTAASLGRQIASSEQRLTSRIDALSAIAQPRQQLAITSGAAIVRTDPNTNAKRLGRLSEGTAVTALTCDGHWCRCEYTAAGGTYQQGWIYKRRLAFFSVVH